MANINLIDRRLNPKDKNLGNRQRFIKRNREAIKKRVDESLGKTKIADAGSNGDIAISTKGIGEPRFTHSQKGGERDSVHPRNKKFVTGDRIKKPEDGAGGRGKEGSLDGEGEDDFVFTLSREEYLDFLFEDMELPDLAKKTLMDTRVFRPQRAGYTTSGVATNMDVRRTMLNSMGRRRALGRPAGKKIGELKQEIEALEARSSDLSPDERGRLAFLEEELPRLKRRQRAVPFIDPLDIRYRRFEQRPEPATKAVMFCLMDVSGSMGEREKDLAKRFFILLHLFLEQHYEKVELVFIRHTHTAKEVDEETFFQSTETGGTAVSTALVEMQRVVSERYPVSDWNIYAAQASDGDNTISDNPRCLEILNTVILPICQYYAYIEIRDETGFGLFDNKAGEKELWRGYDLIRKNWKNFAMNFVSHPRNIFPVLHQLFAKKGAAHATG